MYPAEVLRLMLRDQTLKKVCYPPACRGVLPLARGEWARDQREKSAINERIPVNEKQAGACWSIHEVNIKRPRPQGARRRSKMIFEMCYTFTSVILPLPSSV